MPDKKYLINGDFVCRNDHESNGHTHSKGQEDAVRMRWDGYGTSLSPHPHKKHAPFVPLRVWLCK